MANFKPRTTTQFAARDVFMGDLPLLDEEFDLEIDFSDAHEATLEITNQFDTHTKH
ncbi:MAG: hypothetical protein ACOYNL_06370 [Rickettsiales bacterium]